MTEIEKELSINTNDKTRFRGGNRMRKNNMHRGILILLLSVSLWASGCGKADRTVQSADVKITETAVVNETDTKGSETEKESFSWFEQGEWSDGVYTNTQTGITITLPEGWTRFSDEELMQVLNTGYDQMTDEQKKQYEMSRKNQQSIYDMGAAGVDGQSSFLFMNENLGLSPITARISEEAYLEVVKKQIEETQLNYTFGEFSEREIAGKNWKVLSMKSMGLVQWFFVHKADKRMEAMIITLPESGESTIDDILSGVKSVETAGEAQVTPVS